MISFDPLTQHYNIMNTIMSLGQHTLWRQKFCDHIMWPKPQTQQWRILDIGCGTGDILTLLLARSFIHRVRARFFAYDPSKTMLGHLKARLQKTPLWAKRSHIIHGYGESLPFADNSMHVCTMSFSLRNMYDKNAALTEMYRVLKPQCYAYILEFHAPKHPIFASIWKKYASLWPMLATLCGTKPDAYAYLYNSIQNFDDHTTLCHRFRRNGFDIHNSFSMNGGIVHAYHLYKSS